MNKIIKIGFIVSILCLILVIPIFVLGFIGNLLLPSIICGCLYLIYGIILFKFTYPEFLIKNRKSKRWCKTLSAEELEIVEDAKELIKRVDNSIVISEFNVYKVRFLMHGWFDYDETTQELNIFIPFKFFLRLGGKNLCFLAVLHEVLHSQNLKKNIRVFNKKFLEGLNQLLTIWLIENYSEKYNMPKNKKISLRLRKKTYVNLHFLEAYPEEVKMVKGILEKSDIDLKEIFLKYINFQPEFFKDFVPSKYFEKQ